VDSTTIVIPDDVSSHFHSLVYSRTVVLGCGKLKIFEDLGSYCHSNRKNIGKLKEIQRVFNFVTVLKTESCSSEVSGTIRGVARFSE
jgi:hypothetical protein